MRSRGELTREFLTPEQVADLLQLNTTTVYRLIRQRKLAAARIGRTYCISSQDLEGYLAAHSTIPSLREALFRRVMAIAERNPGVDSDEVLAELERIDQEARQGRRLPPWTAAGSPRSWQAVP